MDTQITLQLKVASYTYEQLIQTAKDIWNYDIHGEEIQSCKLYVKPDEHRCYCVINEQPFSFGL